MSTAAGIRLQPLQISGETWTSWRVCLRCAAAMQRELAEKEADIEQLGRERERQSGKEVKELSQSADELSKRCGQLYEALISEH